MSSFTDPLAVEQLPEGDEWVTLRDFSFWYECDDTLPDMLSVRCKSRLLVPAGTRSDFASIPRLLWPLIGHPAGNYAQASVMHDELYRRGAEPGALPRARCDELFLEGMRVLGVPWWKRRLMWAGVRLGGASAYAASKGSK